MEKVSNGYINEKNGKVIAEEPLISVIVPVYNVEKYLDRCVKSIVNQTYKNLEIIIVDDGSPDNCPKMCDDWAKKDKRIRVIHKKNGGLSDARNKGIEVASGEYIGFVDSDDYIDKNYISVLYNLIKRYNVMLAVADNYIEYIDGCIFNNSTYEEYETNPEKFFYKMLWGIRDLDNGAWTKLYKRELFNNIKFPIGKNYEDTSTIYKIVDKCDRIAVKSISIYHYMKRKDSITQGKFNEKKLELIDATYQLTNYIRNKYKSLDNACDRKLLWSYFSVLSQYVVSSDKNKNIEKKLYKYIKRNRWKVFKFKETPKRDKIGILCSLLGVNFYRFSWKIYLKITKKY